jgi:inner membrane protein
MPNHTNISSSNTLNRLIMENLKFNIYLKLGIIIFIALFLIASTSMIKKLIEEREGLKYSAGNEISSKWGNAQTICGPFITVPYNRYEKQVNEDKSEKVITYPEHIHFLPENLNITGNVNPEKRKRGIYEVVVYDSELTISGEFKNINASDLNIDNTNILWDKAVLTTGISDLRGIENQLTLNWNDAQISFDPGTTTNDVVTSGMNAKIPSIVNGDTTSYKYSFKLDLKGSSILYFVPVGKTTKVNLKSTWNNPKFDGAFITDNNKVTDSGFEANWKILHLNRNFPQVWTNAQYLPAESAFGVDLIVPVESYQKIMRSVKYAALFIAFTFLVFFFVEVLKKKFIHPIQYILVGVSLIIFYTLLLSISEHSDYNTAFVISALSTLLLISAYVRAILKSWSLTVMISGILLILYTFNFVIIQMQDYSLLIGSIGLFVVLALIMFLSRKVDWYALKAVKKDDANAVTEIEKE